MPQTRPRNIGLCGADIHLKTADSSLGPAVGSVYSYSNGSFELSLGVYPTTGSTLVFDIHEADGHSNERRPLAAIVKGQIDDVRIEIGQVIIAEGTAQVHFFGMPPFDARIVF